MSTPPPQNVLLVDKPAGMTSFDVIRRLRRQTGLRKFGHAGTLDPAATGLLLIGYGPGTKALASLTKLDKDYVADIFLGVATTTGDRDGEVVDAHALPAAGLGREAIDTAVAKLVGELTLPVSAYSAIKRDGVPMYKRARAAAARGETYTDVPERTMLVHSATVTHSEAATYADCSGCLVTVHFSVASGTYIRSLAEALGRALGYPAHLATLRRTRIGPYAVADAAALPDITSLA